MARIWPVHDGEPPTRDEPWAEIPIADAISLFELGAGDFVADLSQTPRFWDVSHGRWHGDFKHIAVEIEPGEARRIKWRAGFYLSRMKPADARSRMIQHALVSVLGADNVVRVESRPATDSQGRGALKVTVVITPGAVERLGNGVALDALITLRRRLNDMHEDRTPIVAYATVAELAEHGHP